MIAWLKDILRPIQKLDPDLGQMRYVRDTHTWEGRTQFAPVGREVEVLLSGRLSGPTQEQRDFLRALEARYGDLWPLVKANLSEAAAPMPEVGATPKEFTLVAIDLPEEVGRDASWELCYETEPKTWFFAVQMRGWIPENVSVEC